MNHSTIGLSLLIVAHLLYAPSLPSWAIFGLYMMVLVGIFSYVIAHMARHKAFKAWLNRYF